MDADDGPARLAGPASPGAIVGIRAKKGDEWVRMYEGKPLISMNRDQKDNGGQYWRWSPPICRTHFKTDTIRIEMDTVAIADWNYIDYVEVLGSEEGLRGRERGACAPPRPRCTSAVSYTHLTLPTKA